MFNTQALLDDSKEVALEVDVHIQALSSGCRQNHNVKLGNKSFKNIVTVVVCSARILFTISLY
jgi:hypothetical protein